VAEGWPNCCSVGRGKLAKLGVKGDGAVEVVALEDVGGATSAGCAVSSLVIAKTVGTLPELLAFLFFEVGPDVVDGDVWRDWFRGVIVADVVCEGCGEVARLIEGVNCCILKFRCMPCKSELECDRRKGPMVPAGPGFISNVPSLGNAPDPAYVCPSDPLEVCVVKGGILCVLWSSVIMIEEVIS